MAKNKTIENEVETVATQINPMTKVRKATDILRQKRYNMVMQLRIDYTNYNGRTLFEIVKKNDTQNLWDGVEYDTFKHYYEKVNKTLNKSFDITNEKLKNKYSNLTLKRLNNLYQNAISKKDYKNALSIQNELTKFFTLGYYSKPQTENNISIMNNLPNKIEIEIIKSDSIDLNEATDND